MKGGSYRDSTGSPDQVICASRKIPCNLARCASSFAFDQNPE